MVWPAASSAASPLRAPGPDHRPRPQKRSAPEVTGSAGSGSERLVSQGGACGCGASSSSRRHSRQQRVPEMGITGRGSPRAPFGTVGRPAAPTPHRPAQGCGAVLLAAGWWPTRRGRLRHPISISRCPGRDQGGGGGVHEEPSPIHVRPEFPISGPRRSVASWPGDPGSKNAPGRSRPLRTRKPPGVPAVEPRRDSWPPLEARSASWGIDGLGWRGGAKCSAIAVRIQGSRESIAERRAASALAGVAGTAALELCLEEPVVRRAESACEFARHVHVDDGVLL